MPRWRPAGPRWPSGRARPRRRIPPMIRGAIPRGKSGRSSAKIRNTDMRTPRQRLFQSRRRRLLDALEGKTTKSPSPVLARAAARDLRRWQAPTPDKPRGRGLSMLAPDNPAQDVPRVLRGRNARRYVRLAALQGAHGVFDDPARALSYWIRRAAHPGPQPSPCRVLDPATGAVKYLIDPITRRTYQPGETPPP